MNKKIFAMLFISILLIVSIGFISAADDGNDAGNASKPIKVKIIWNDNNTTDRPTQILVNLLDGGKVVEVIKLNDSSSWNATFKTQDDGKNYKVQLTDDLSNYSVSYNGSVEKGFVINCTLKESPSNATGNGSSLQKNDTHNATDNKTNDGNANDKKASDSTGNSSNNDKKASGEAVNGSAKDVNDKAGNQTSNETNKNSTPKKEESNNGTDVVKKTKKPANNPEPQVSITKLKNTGLPIIALSLIAILGGYGYLRYRK